MQDLRPGEKVTVRYQDAQGVFVASQVTQQPVRLTGTVKSIDRDKNTLTVRHGLEDKTFVVATNCVVTLHGGKAGTLASVLSGERVTVTYETWDGRSTARQLAQTNATFSGNLTALDLSERTVKAKGLLGTKRFNLAKDCTVVINGRTDAHLRDLKPDEPVTISYDEINGVNVASRLATSRSAEQEQTMAAESAR
jgi:hypothetical protein